MNSTIDNLREAVLTDARAVAYEIVQDAIKAGQQASAKVDARIAEDHAAAMAKAEEETERQRQRLFAEAEAKIQRERLKAREAMIGSVLAEARKKLAEVASDHEKGRELLLALAIEGAKAISGDAVRLVVRSGDRARVDAAFLDAVKQQTGKRAALAEETLDALGGVVVMHADGRERFDNTLDNRLARQMADVRAMIWVRLSHAG